MRTTTANEAMNEYYAKILVQRAFSQAERILQDYKTSGVRCHFHRYTGTVVLQILRDLCKQEGIAFSDVIVE